jgi:hypothetical protein
MRALDAGLGPLPASHPAPTGTAPLSATGIFNLAALGTGVTLVYDGTPKGMGSKSIVRIKITLITTANKLAWQKVSAGAAAPVFTADAVGTASVGSLVPTVEYVTIPSNMDLYLVASAAGTICQVHVEEV